jgi:hypothetical protein
MRELWEWLTDLTDLTAENELNKGGVGNITRSGKLGLAKKVIYIRIRPQKNSTCPSGPSGMSFPQDK